MKKRHLITAALPYANGPIHIGHLAGCYLPADIYTRFLKAKGEEVLFICGTDEHGVAIELKARKENTTPQAVVDKYYEVIRDSFKDFGIDFSHFSRTSRPIHHETAQAFFKKLYDNGRFKEIETAQFYDEEAKQFLADRYIVGTCPKCGHDGAYGDQCEKCGSSLSPDELINPRSALSGAAPVKRITKNWFLPMDELAEAPGFKAYAKRVEGWKTNVKGQFSSWIQQGLQPRSMTRDLDWGVPVPVAGAEGKVLYVWFDAPIGYISATREYFAEQGDPEAWKTWWQDPSSSLVHFIGKDNIVFHTIIFPMILNEHGDYNLPDQVPANEFLNLEGDKLSTSRNWAIWLHEYLLEFPGKQDELRYTLTSIAPETKDSDFTWKDYQGRVNSELVAILGNFVNRVMVLTHKYFEGLVPGNKLRPDTAQRAAVMDAIRANSEEITGFQSEMIQSLTDFRFREAQATMMNIARAGNRFLAETEPWKLYKTDAAAVAVILDHALQICAQLALACEPFLPYTSGRLLEQLQWEPDTQVRRAWWREQQPVKPLEAGHQLGQPELLFRNVEDEMMDAQRAKLVKTPEKMEMTSPAYTPLKPEITYEDFAKLDLRVGQVIAAEKVAGADKLLQLTIDLGFEQRTVVSGIAMHFSAEEIVGGKVTLLANLAPRKLRGIMSQGMILMAENKDGKLLFVAPNASADNGSTIS
ncbi:MAG: methionine--tRNA ligase [Sphingobacteriaceae bacterium]|nr:methionine--tRNA ligase [Sphingobacteriaceae bacterium]